MKKRVSKYAGVRYIKETIKLPDIRQDDSGLDYDLKMKCNFADISNLPSYGGVGPKGAIKALYARYCITGVKWTFIPVYNQSSVGGARASTVLYAINRDPQDSQSGEEDLIRQNDCKFTNSNRKFSVYVKHPTPAIAATAQQNPYGAGYTNTQYKNPLGGAANPNQVAFAINGNKWIWLPTRVDTLDEQKQQCPDHYGLDLVLKSNPTMPHEGVVIYNVYQTIYLALKEQD